MGNSLELLTKADRMLALAVDLTDIAEVRDIAVAARAYAKAAQLGIETTNKAALIKVKAERKAGECLARLEKGSGPGRGKTIIPGVIVSEYRQALDETGTSNKMAAQWQRMATVPEPEFQEHINNVLENGQELTSAGVDRLALAEHRKRVKAERREAVSPAGKYRVLYADPPWSYGNSGIIGNDNYGRAKRHYPDMSITELVDMGEDIKEIAEKDAVLFLWVTSPLLAECFPVIEAWGFKYKTSFVWDKIKHNFGHYNSVRHEMLLICTRGSCTPDAKTLIDSVQSIEKSRKHSEKPEQFRQIIDSLYTSGARLELFARADAPGWDRWGNE